LEESHLKNSNNDLSYREEHERAQKLEAVKANAFVVGGMLEEKEEITLPNYKFIKIKVLVPTDRPNGTTGKNAAHVELTAAETLADVISSINVGDFLKVKGEIRTRNATSRDGRAFTSTTLTAKEIKKV